MMCPPEQQNGWSEPFGPQPNLPEGEGDVKLRQRSRSQKSRTRESGTFGIQEFLPEGESQQVGHEGPESLEWGQPD